MSAFDKLMSYVRTSEAVGQAAGHLYWDRDTMMPDKAQNQRAEVMAAMESVLHERRTAPMIGEWLASVDESSLSEADKANVRLIRKDYEQKLKIPADLPGRLARETSLAHSVWKQARSTDSKDQFMPALARVVAIKREEAAALADGGDPYDALLERYEAGLTASAIEPIFDCLRRGLVELLDGMDRDSGEAALNGVFPVFKQLEFARELAQSFSYDFGRGRLDVSVHPFSSGSGDDARITTRTDEADPFNCIYSTIHETGHAVYERNIDRKFAFEPVGRAASFGVHESQSRIFENQLGRGRAFCEWLFERLRGIFGDIGVASEQEFYAAANRVNAGFIRTEADELRYNLHILLRFDLEREVIQGKLKTADIEEAWNARFKADFGRDVDRPSNGFLQDVHWSVGEFGYFPTYALGNIYAGCLFEAMSDSLPDLDESLRLGSAEPAAEWLRRSVHSHGSLRPPRDTINAACGFEASEKPLLMYLEKKFSRG